MAILKRLSMKVIYHNRLKRFGRKQRGENDKG